MSNLLSVFPRVILLAVTLLSPPHTLTGASGGTNFEKPTADTSALAELWQAVGTVATVAPAKSGLVAFQQASFTSKLPSNVSIGNHGISIAWPNKQRVVFRDFNPPLDESKMVNHSYRGMNVLTGLVWITRQRYEDLEQLLTSQASGRVFEVANEPSINRSGTLLFAKQNECFVMTDECPPGFQLWRINKGALKLLKEVRLQNYFVVSGGWISATTVRVETASLQDMMNGKRTADMKRQLFDVTVR
ncbi:hypothetical protein [Hymenobacter perfusus]|uniref:Uncharacterized protein n=1 Tax=Hymenobacter perfusus TaxID=1236770 RepID=A0A428K9X8_9BACT|nr:hypothetical protein [Hymenobacter perfusus]RSK43276.1 hypothetical protein EI293_10210 [Hymenobacter perfusus]